MNNQVRATAVFGEIVVFAVELMAIQAKTEFHSRCFWDLTRGRLCGQLVDATFGLADFNANKFLEIYLETFWEPLEDSSIQSEA